MVPLAIYKMHFLWLKSENFYKLNEEKEESAHILCD